jgi:ArsR family transcriptional regulator, arsenate/arsenite/antimonite-responsive transcriptional repressor
MIEVPLAQGAPTTSLAAADFLGLMADPTRRRIFLALMRGETCNCEMAGLLGVPPNLLSHHLRRLRQAGLIRTRRDVSDRRWVYYSVDRDALSRVHREMGMLFDPGRLGERVPQCGPTSREASRGTLLSGGCAD